MTVYEQRLMETIINTLPKINVQLENINKSLEAINKTLEAVNEQSNN